MGVTAENVAAKFGLDRVSVFEKEAGGQWKTTCCLGFVGHYTTQIYRNIRIPIKQPRIKWNVTVELFFVASGEEWFWNVQVKLAFL